MEVVSAHVNPDVEMTLKDIGAYGGGGVLGVAVTEVVSNEIVARGIPKWGLVVGQVVLAGAVFYGAAKTDGTMRKVAIGAGTGVSVNAISTLIEVLQGA